MRSLRSSTWLLFVAWGAVAGGCGDSASPERDHSAGAAGAFASSGAAGQPPTGGAAGVGSSAGSSVAGSATGGAGSAAGGAVTGGRSGGSAGIGAMAGGGGTGDDGGASSSSGSGGATAGAGGGEPLVAITIYLAGDSTVSNYADTPSPRDQAGWGQMLHEYLNPLAKVDNRAIGGRTSRRFIEEGHLKEISDDLRAGDYLLVQFGTNDGNESATYTLDGKTIPYYLEPATDFKSYLRQYIEAARAKQARVVLVTPPPRNSAYCTGGNGTGAYAEAMRELGAAEQVAVSDLNRRAVDYLEAICPAPTPENFFLLRSDGTVDGTHFQENGARKLASFVSAGLSDTPSPLARYVE